MKNYIFSLLFLLLSFTQCKQSEPTAFSARALQQEVITPEGETLTLAEVFENHKGETLFIDIWASWCGDCVKSIPKVKELKNQYGAEVTFLYFSMDKEKEEWLAATNKYALEGVHFYMGNDWKSTFNQSINLNWIPRFMIIGKDGSIKLFKAEKVNDPKIEQTLRKELEAK